VSGAGRGTERSHRTRVLRVEPHRPDPGLIAEAARCLAQGGLVAFPTETVYGLGADATNPQAVDDIFRAKGRPADNPLIVHVASPGQVRALVREMPHSSLALMQAFWPGPLSLVLPRSDAVAPAVSCGLDTVAVRMPDHPVALDLIRVAGVPVAAPSANVSGRPSPTRAEHVLADLDGRIDYLLDAGPCRVGVESTVLDLTGPEPVVLRPGGVVVEDLGRVVGRVRIAGGPEAAGPGGGGPARSPGLRYRHYSPRARLVLVRPRGERAGEGRPAAGAAAAAAAAVARIAFEEASAGRRTGVACTSETAASLYGRLPEGTTVCDWGSRTRPGDVAARIFTTLRELDRAGVDVIVAEGLPSSGLGLAVNDRLGRAAAAVVDAAGAGPAVAERETPLDAHLASPRAVLLVCAGNTCRSPMAEVLLKDMLHRRGAGDLFEVGSAGVAACEGLPATSEAVEVMKERGLDLSSHRSRPVTLDLVTRSELVLCMERAHKDSLVEAYPWAADRIFTLKGYAGEAAGAGDEDVQDPIGRGIEAYRKAAEEIERASEAAAERLLHPPDLTSLLSGDEPLARRPAHDDPAGEGPEGPAQDEPGVEELEKPSQGRPHGEGPQGPVDEGEGEQ